jgi:hypothetical protein
MPSLQNPLPNSKSAKFIAANPLGPMADPFAGMVSQSNQSIHHHYHHSIFDRILPMLHPIQFHFPDCQNIPISSIVM